MRQDIKSICFRQEKEREREREREREKQAIKLLLGCLIRGRNFSGGNYNWG